MLSKLQNAFRAIFGNDASKEAPPEIHEVPQDDKILYCNIGGGAGFKHKNWRNLEGVEGVHNQTPFSLDAACQFPFGDSSLKLVYSSHVLEHLDPPTVSRVLRESLRVLEPDGRLLIKIPDFTALHEAWRRDEFGYFADEFWGFQLMTPTFPNKGVADTIHSRAAYCFCGFWNRPFGNLFAKHDLLAPGAYNGPPVLSDDEFRRILDQPSMHNVAADLRRIVVANETDYTFNHQNAWSEAEFRDLLAENGFVVLSADKNAIPADNQWIPGIDEMFGISAYFVARPARAEERAGRLN